MDLRPIAEIPLEERKEILIDDQIMTSREVQEKYNISAAVLNHIRYHHGKQTKRKGEYHKDLVGDTYHPLITKIKDMKAAGYNSLQTAERLKIDLDVVNRNW